MGDLAGLDYGECAEAEDATITGLKNAAKPYEEQRVTNVVLEMLA